MADFWKGLWDAYYSQQHGTVVLHGAWTDVSDFLSFARKYAEKLGIKLPDCKSPEETAAIAEVQRIIEKAREEYEKEPRRGGLIIPERFQ